MTLRVDFKPAAQLADRIDAVASRAVLRQSAFDAANEVATRFSRTAARAMNKGINLTDAYVESKMRVVRAAAVGKDTVRAEVVTRGDLTVMGNYPIEQLRNAGTPVRSGVSAGRRPSGVRAEITRGAPATEPQWFTMRLRGSGKTGVFVRRNPDGRAVHLYGPSPYSLFRYQITALSDELRADLETTVTRVAADAVGRVL